MPNPLSRVVSNSSVAIDPTVEALKPDVAHRIALVIGAWAYVEHVQSVLLARFLGAKAHIGAAVWNALTGAPARRDVLEAAANSVLNDADLELFHALMKLVRAEAGQRNALVHDLWGHDEEVPDALILIPSKDWLSRRAGLSRHDMESSPRSHASPLLGEVMQVYTSSDLIALHRRIVRAHQHLEVFCQLMDVPPEQRDAIRQQLSRAPEIQAFLRKTDLENTPAARHNRRRHLRFRQESRRTVAGTHNDRINHFSQSLSLRLASKAT